MIVAVPALGWSTPGVVMIAWLQSRDRHPRLEDGEKKDPSARGGSGGGLGRCLGLVRGRVS